MKDHLSRGLAANGVGTAASSVSSLVAVIALTRAGNSLTLGWYLFLSAALLFTYGIASRGLDRALVRELATTEPRLRPDMAWSLLWRSVPGVAAAAMLLGFFAGSVADSGGRVSAAAVSVWFALEVSRQLVAELARGLPAPWVTQIFGFPARNVVIMVYLLTAQFLGWTVEPLGLVASLIAINGTLLMLAVAHLAVRRQGPSSLDAKDSWARAKRAGWEISVSNVTRQVLNQGDVILAGVLAGNPARFATYALAARLVTGVGNASVVTNNAIFPLAADRIGTTEVLLHRDRRMLRLGGLIGGVPVGAVLAFATVAWWTNSSLLGSAQRAAFGLMVILAVGQVVNCSLGNFVTYLMARGDEQFCRRISLLTLALVVPLEALSASRENFVALAVFSSLGGSLPSVLAERASKRRFGVAAFGRAHGQDHLLDLTPT